jgi:hypothetical protein
MCRASVRQGGHLWYLPLSCTTDADDLFDQAYESVRVITGRLVSVEPCALAMGSSLAPMNPKAARAVSRLFDA